MNLWRWVLGLGVAAATVAAFWVPDATANWQSPSLARMLFFHLPCALITVFFLLAQGYFGLRCLQTRKPEWDARLAAALELGALFGFLTLTTGILFSKVQWGEWWQWDPRQTSFLLVMLILGAGLALRVGLADEQRRAMASSAYSVASLLPNFFLIFVFPRLPSVRQESFHPSTTIQQRELDGTYGLVLIVVGLMLLALALTLYSLRVRAALLELKLEELNGNLEMDSDGATTSRVVRPVSVSSKR